MGVNWSNRSGRTAQLPIRWPGCAIRDRYWEPACPTGHSGKLPTSNDCLCQTVRVAAKPLALANGQVKNPVGIELLCGVKVRNSAQLIGRPGIDNLPT